MSTKYSLKAMGMFSHPYYGLYLQRIPDNHPVVKFEYTIENGRCYTKQPLEEETFLDLRHLDFNYTVNTMFRNPCRNDDVVKCAMLSGNNVGTYNALVEFMNNYYSPTNLSQLNISSCSIRTDQLYSNPKVIKDIPIGGELLQIQFFEDSILEMLRINYLDSSNVLGLYKFCCDHRNGLFEETSSCSGRYDYYDGIPPMMERLKLYLTDIEWNENISMEEWDKRDFGDDITYCEWFYLK